MTDRERLIELIYCSGRNYDDYVDEQHEMGMPAHEDFDSWLADDLLANGVIVPPCKVGQKVYDISEYVLGVVAPDIYELRADEMTIEKGADGALNFVYDGLYINNEDIGKTLFFTEAETENALKERVDNG